ncbi:tripartite tricarboxylate transporter substrate binding protein [Roseomonas sp. NAR14]|uniref:Tripartite tricarboxylate transporter substrate binding protein n=1 Tax=Roseomonas acroporae TaxID=2937791 RepID=A0A9X1Y899_9PROT|nr:tripartite tricarboxylate transporter substrate binding protein [Roseomonas acroporae]MCK8784055.1 tripartite tricarboxylate transporter substrate binding protein [Roseomonas acroporae]
MAEERTGGGAVSRRRALGMAALAAGTGMATGTGRSGRALAQQGGQRAAWPTQPVRYINVFPPGAATDILSRIWCARMSEVTGQQFVVENRSGSGGTVGQAAIARSPADGYTIGLGSVASLAIAPSLYPSLPYDAGRDFTFVSGLWKLPNLLILNNEVPARSVPELIDLLRRNPGRYSYASSGSGTTVHLSGEMFKRMAGVDMVHVPYRGSAPATVDLLAGRVHMIFDNITGALNHAREGKVRALAVTAAERSPVAPDLPTIAEFLPGYEITSWGSVVGPPGLPPAAVERLSALTRQVLADPDFARSYHENGATTWWTTPAELAGFRGDQERRFAELIRASGARVD